jgi:hypothetical protein
MIFQTLLYTLELQIPCIGNQLPKKISLYTILYHAFPVLTEKDVRT